MLRKTLRKIPRIPTPNTGMRAFRPSRPLYWRHISTLNSFEIKGALVERGLPTSDSDMKNLASLRAFLDNNHNGFDNGITTSAKLAEQKKQVEDTTARINDNTHVEITFQNPSPALENEVFKFLESEAIGCEVSRLGYLLTLSGKYRDVRLARSALIKKFCNKIPNLEVFCKGLFDPNHRELLSRVTGQESIVGNNVVVELWKNKNEREILCTLCSKILEEKWDEKSGRRIIELPLLINGSGYEAQMKILTERYAQFSLDKNVDVEVTKCGNLEIYHQIMIRGSREKVFQVACKISSQLRDAQGELFKLKVPQESVQFFRDEKWPALQKHIFSNYKIAQAEMDMNQIILQRWVDEDIDDILEDIDYQMYVSECVNTKSKRNINATRREHLQTFDLHSVGIGGMSAELTRLLRESFLSRVVSDQFKREMGLQHVKGIMLYGPPGCGKTTIARHIGKILAAENVTMVNSPELENKYVGETENKIRELFAPAKQAKAKEEQQLHVLIFDEIDAITRTRGGPNAKARDGSVYQLLCEMDGLKKHTDNIVVIGLTNRIQDIDSALLRPGRFETKIEIKLPDEKGRAEILKLQCAQMQENGRMDDIDVETISQMTEGFSGADLAAAIRLATNEAIETMPKEEQCFITHALVEKAIEEIRLAKLTMQKPNEQEGKNDRSPTFQQIQ